MLAAQNNQKKVTIKLLSSNFTLYSNSMILLVNLKGGKRAEASEWALEVRKLLNGIVNSIEALENIMNQNEKKDKLYLNDNPIKISDEKLYWLTLYLIDNSILRIYACLDKVAQMARCYFECKENGGHLNKKERCGCLVDMDEKNCNFGSLLNSILKDKTRNSIIADALKELNSNNSVQVLREYRNTFTHRKHKIDQSFGLDPNISSKYNDDNTVETVFSFGNKLPNVNWFRVEIVNANNAIVECLEKIGVIIFPRDLKININQKE